MYQKSWWQSSIQHRLSLQYFLFTQFLLCAHKAGHEPQKNKNWELKILGHIFEIKQWKVGQYDSELHYMIILSSRLLKKSMCVFTWISNIAIHVLLSCCRLSLQSIQNHCIIMPDIVSKHLSADIWSCCAVLLEFKQVPFPKICNLFRSSALHKIW